MKCKNNNGPSIDSCGTPDVTATHSDVEPSSTTLWDRSFKWSVIQPNNLPENPIFCNLWMSRLWLAESNAFEK